MLNELISCVVVVQLPLAGCRITQIHLLCGGIIPLLSALELAMAKHADKLGLT